MDHRTVSRIRHHRGRFPRLLDLLRKHDELNLQVDGLNKQPYLAPEEEQSLQQLKIQKLMLRDTIEVVLHYADQESNVA